MVVRHTSGTALELALDRPNFLFRVLSQDTVYGVKGDASDGSAFKRARSAHVPFEPDSDTDEQLLARRRWRDSAAAAGVSRTAAREHSHLAFFARLCFFVFCC